jgi:addiction module HigA family antidote
MRMHNPPHPGRIIKEAIEAIPMSVTGFAAHIGVSRVALSRVLNERAGVTPEMSIKISEAFGQTRRISGSICRTITTSGRRPGKDRTQEG